MSEHPILFSGPMVRAILGGRKTMTRRVIKPQPPPDLKEQLLAHGVMLINRAWFLCPYGQPGDRLWVREAFKLWPNGEIFYAATPAPEKRGKFLPLGNWKPSIFMPRWASRITLEITAVRVERIQDISEEDIYAEGCLYTPWLPSGDPLVFQNVWDSLNAKRGYGWENNPWTWVISFKRLP